MRNIVLLALIASALIVSGCAGMRSPGHLSIVFVDVEGGAATLIVTPAGESVLIDSGFPGERDAGRIHRAARQAGLSRIDHYVTTHWHNDHMGGIGPLSEKIRIRTFHDRGGLDGPPADRGSDPALLETYRKVSRGKSRTLNAGDQIPLRSPEGSPPLSLRCLVSNGQVGDPAATPESGSACSKHQPKPPDPSDNARSLGFVLKYGDFEFLDLGDLTWNIEHLLVCPQDRIGPVDLYQVTHHGQDSSNNPAVLRAASPRVAVVNNGPRKGGSKVVYADLKAVPEIEAIYQLHRNVQTTDADNAPSEHIANLEESCAGEPVSVAVAPDGKSYTVKVGRAGGSRSFAVR